MSRFRLRPRFQQEVGLGIDAAEARITEYFETTRRNFEVKHFPRFICLRIPEEERHFWSPRLNLSLEESGENTTRINGVYGPNANVWSLFLYGYLGIGFLALIAAVLGISQWVIGKEPWGFWWLLVAAIGLVLLYLVGRTGRRLGARQTLRLHKEYQAAIGEPVAIR